MPASGKQRSSVPLEAGEGDEVRAGCDMIFAEGPKQREEQDMIRTAHFILYVADQKRAAAFYRAALGLKPRLDVPGMI